LFFKTDERNWVYPAFLMFFTLAILSQNHLLMVFSITSMLFLILLNVFSNLMENQGEELYRTTLSYAGLLLSLMLGFAVVSVRGFGSGSGAFPYISTKTVTFGYVFLILGSIGLAGGSPFNTWFSLIREWVSLRFSIIITNLLYLTGGFIIIKASSSFSTGIGTMTVFVFASVSLLGGAGSALIEVDRDKFIRGLRGAFIGIITLISTTGYLSSIRSGFIFLIASVLFLMVLEYLLYYKTKGDIFLRITAFLTISTVPLFTGFNVFTTGFMNFSGMQGWRKYPLIIILLVGTALLMASVMRFFKVSDDKEHLAKTGKIWILVLPVIFLLILPFLSVSYDLLINGFFWDLSVFKLSLNIPLNKIMPVVFSLISIISGFILFITLKGEDGIIYRNESFFTKIPVINWLYFLKRKKVFTLEVYIKPATKAVSYAMFFIDQVFGHPQRYVKYIFELIIRPLNKFIPKEKRY
jgi:hypothetical protein